jgi:GGDEF domain-containing protein
MEGAGRAIPAAWEAVKSSLPGAIGLVGIEGLFGLAVKPGRDRAHTDIINALNDPSVDPKSRADAVLHFYHGIAVKDKDSADNFALNAMRAIRDGKPVDLTSESIKPISLQGEAAPGPQPVTDWEAQDQFKAQEQGKGALRPIETAWDEFMQANGITPTSSREARDAVNRAWFESPEYQAYQKPVVPISDMPHGMNLFTGKPANEKSLNGEDPKQETPNPAAVPPAAAPAAPSAPEAAPVPPLTTEGAAEPPAGEKAVPQVQSEPTPGTKYKSIEQELGHKLSKAKERLATLEARMNNIKTPSDGLKQTLSGQHRLVEDIQKQLTDAKAARDLKTKEGDVNAEKVRIDEEKVQTGGPVGLGSEGEGSADIQQPEEVESETRDKGIKVELTPKEKIEQQEKADRVMQSIIDGTKPEHRLDAQLRSEVQKMFDEGRVEEAFDRLYKDKLTGVYNQNAWERIKDDAELKSAPVAISDLTGFKYFNDTYGHEFGDQILKAYAKSVERFGIKVYRKGGDELAMYHEGYDADALKSAMAEAKQ